MCWTCLSAVDASVHDGLSDCARAQPSYTPYLEALMKAMEMFKGWVREFIDLLLLFIAVGVVVQIAFGSNVPFFGGITNNLMGFVSQLGSNGLVGLIALLVIIAVFNRRTA